MSGFWSSPIGQEIKGDAASAFLSDFSVIPDGTMALAAVKAANIVSKEATQYKEADRYIEITYKLIDGDFKNREVSQKIKVFTGKPEAIHRNLNMLKLVMDLCNFKPTHNNEPTNDDLGALVGKTLGIKIAEWSMPKADGGFMEGNFVREVHSSSGFKCETGIKQEVVHSRSSVDSAFSRNESGKVLDDLDGLPF